LSPNTVNAVLNEVDQVEHDIILQEGTGGDYNEIIGEHVSSFSNFPVKGTEISILAEAGTSRLTPAEYVEELFQFPLHLLGNVNSASDLFAYAG